jgi:hypothetical protein
MRAGEKEQGFDISAKISTCSDAQLLTETARF